MHLMIKYFFKNYIINSHGFKKLKCIMINRILEIFTIMSEWRPELEKFPILFFSKKYFLSATNSNSHRIFFSNSIFLIHCSVKKLNWCFRHTRFI